jgi:undecaprenyl pyrophosphate phosphatase UppP
MPKSNKHDRCKKPKKLIQNKSAVVDLPMRLVIAIIIGTVSLTTILAYITQPCILPSNMIVSVEPLVILTNESNNKTLINLYIRDENNIPIKDAIIISIININLSMPQGINEGYLDVLVKANCYEKINNERMIKIVRGN